MSRYGLKNVFEVVATGKLVCWVLIGIWKVFGTSMDMLLCVDCVTSEACDWGGCVGVVECVRGLGMWSVFEMGEQAFSRRGLSLVRALLFLCLFVGGECGEDSDLLTGCSDSLELCRGRDDTEGKLKWLT